MKQENILVLTYYANYIQNIPNVKKTKDMNAKKNSLNPTSLKKELNTLAIKIMYYKRFSIKEAENTLRFARSPKRKALAAAHLNKVRREQKKFSATYRHLHIAYSELRGMQREKIEKPVYADKINEIELQKIKDMYTQK